jgi:hypothetical protein
VYLPEHYPNNGHLKPYHKSASPSERYKAIVNAVRPLKHLTIRCPTSEDDENFEVINRLGEATRLLAIAVNLRTLDLDLGEPERTYEKAHWFENYVDFRLVPLIQRKEVTYLHLEKFRTSATFWSWTFHSFLRLHKGTLKSLEITDCYSDDWKKILK